MAKIIVNETEITIINIEEKDYISLTDMVKGIDNEAMDWKNQCYLRDYASINQLICLSNLESLNSVLINKGLSQSERLKQLNKVAIQQMAILENTNNRKLLK